MNRPAVTRTKLFVTPPRAAAVQRVQVLARLDAALDVPLTIVSAGAGYGKSTCAAQWLKTRNVEAGWLSVDARDESPRRFLHHFFAALVNAGFEPSQALDRDVWDGETELDALIGHMSNELLDEERELVVVVDDFHLAGDRVAELVIGPLVDVPPPNLHLILLTRARPPFALARLRANGRLVEISEADLQLNVSESGEFLRQTMKLPIGEADAEELASRTEGWVAGLQMAALSLTRQRARSLDAKDFGGKHHLVAEYLVDEVLDTLAADARSAVLRASILTEFDAELLEDVAGSSNGAALLEDLRSRNLFVIPLDETRTTFRFHHLFAELLRHELTDELSEPELVALHSRAADTLRERADLEGALEHAVAAREWESAGWIVLELVNALDYASDHDRMHAWIRAFPAAVVVDSAVLTVARTFIGFLSMESESVFHGLRRSRELFASRPDPNLEAIVDAIEGAVMLHSGEFDAAEVALRRVVEGAQATSHASLMAHFYLPQLLLFRGAVEEGNAYLEQLEGLAPSLELGTRIIGRCLRCNLAVERGELSRARGILEAEVSEAYARYGDGVPRNMAVAMGWLAEICTLQGEVDAAKAWIDRAEELGEGVTGVPATVGFKTQVLRAKLGMGSPEQAVGMLTAVADHLEAINLMPHAAHLRLHAILAMLDARTPFDEIETARDWLGRPGIRDMTSMVYAPTPSMCARLWESRLVLCRALVSVGELHEAHAFATAELQRAETEGRRLSMLEWQLLLADVAFRRGETAEARRHVESAVEIAWSQNVVDPFAQFGGDVHRVAKELATSLGRLAFRERLDAFEGRELDLPAGVEPLSDRELEVLQLIAQGATNKEAGRQLFVAPSTVKKHLEHVYDKLGVRNRTKAVAMARELGYLN